MKRLRKHCTSDDEEPLIKSTNQQINSNTSESFGHTDSNNINTSTNYKEENIHINKGIRQEPPLKRKTELQEDEKDTETNIINKNVKSFTSSLLGQVTSTRTTTPHVYSGGTFATSEINTAHDRDSFSLLEKKLINQKDAITSASNLFVTGQTEYKGMNAYSNFVTKNITETTSRSKISGTMGPLRAPTNVRGISRMDYQPDICKDYKETGFCSFGDTCKFLHDRSNYTSSWKLDQEWNIDQKRKEQDLRRKVLGIDTKNQAPNTLENDTNVNSVYASKNSTDGTLPFACFICRKDFTNPIVTNCMHYFCEPCALNRYKTDTRCAICSKQTFGVFNVAKKILAQQQEQEKKKLSYNSNNSSHVVINQEQDKEEKGGWA